MTEMKVVRVDWVDAASPPDGWMSPQDLGEYLEGRERGMPVSTVGFLFEKTKHRVVLIASHANSDGHRECVDSVWVIPRGCITRIRECT